jgi:hypothetical protein
MKITRLSTKGLLRPTERCPEAHLDQVAGCLRSKGKPKSPLQMSAAIRAEALRRRDCGRY